MATRKKVKSWYWLIAVAWLIIILAERACASTTIH